MLQVAVIREQNDKVLEGLRKRNFKEAENLIAQILEKDNLRKTRKKRLMTGKQKQMPMQKDRRVNESQKN